MNEWIPVLQSWVGLHNAPAVEFLTDWAGPLGWWIALQLVFLLVGIRRGLQLAAFASLAMTTNTWLKWLIAEPRPFFIDPGIEAIRATPGFGMPSGHAQGAFAVWGGLAWQTRSNVWWLMLFLVLAVTTALSRVYLGVHSPAQVIAGSLLGVAGLVGLIWVWPRLCTLFAAFSTPRLWLALIVLSAIALAINQAVFTLGDNFVVPVEWLNNAARAAGVEPENMELHLWSNPGPLFIALAAGFFAVSIVERHTEDRLPGGWSKSAAVALSVVANALFIAVLGQLGAETVLLPALAFAQPFVGVLVPRVIVRNITLKSA